MAVPSKVVIGAPMKEFVGGSFNALVDEFWRNRGQRGGSQPRQSRSGSAGPMLTVMVKNMSGAAREPGHVLGLDDLLLTLTEDVSQTYREPVLQGITPTTADHASKFAICKDHIAANAIGACWLHGCGWVKANITDTGHTHLAIADGVADYLASGTSGYEIVWKEADTGRKWALVLLGGGGGGDGFLRWGTISTAGSAASTEGTATTDGEIDLYGGSTVTFNNYYPDEAPLGRTACVDGNNNIVTWSCTGW